MVQLDCPKYERNEHNKGGGELWEFKACACVQGSGKGGYWRNHLSANKVMADTSPQNVWVAPPLVPVQDLGGGTPFIKRGGGGGIKRKFATERTEERVPGTPVKGVALPPQPPPLWGRGPGRRRPPRAPWPATSPRR